jgi:hypothetical protein
LRRLRIERVEIGQTPADGECQLRAGAQPCMGGQCAMDLNESAGREVVVIEELSRKGRCSIRVLAFNCERIGSTCRQLERRCRGGRADPAEPSSASAPEIEDAEVEAGVRLDTDDTALAHRLGANQERLLTSLPTSATVATPVAAVVRRKLRRVNMREL